MSKILSMPGSGFYRSAINNLKVLRELDQGENDVKGSLVSECNACLRHRINMQHGSFGLSDF